QRSSAIAGRSRSTRPNGPARRGGSPWAPSDSVGAVPPRDLIRGIGDVPPKLGWLQDFDLRPERQHVDRGALDRRQSEGGGEPARIVCGHVPLDAERLQPAQERGEAPALDRDADRRAPRPTGPPLPRVPIGWARQARVIALEQLEA